MKIREELQKMRLFSSLDESSLDELIKISQIVHYDKDAVLFTQGNTSHHLMVLLDGTVSIYKHDDKGNEIVISYFYRHSLLAEAATLRHIPLPSSARFHTDGTLFKIPLENFEALLLSNPKVSYEIIQSLLAKVELLQQNIHFNLANTSKDKVLNFYAKNSSLSVDLKQYEIASILGISPETLSRTCKKLVEQGQLLLTSSGYKISL